MGIKSFNPYTPSRRHMTSSDFNEITKSTPEKSLVVSLKKNAGRNNQGKITVRHRGGGNRRKYRIIDFKRRKDDVPATVKSIEYDPNRTANIALICYADGEKAYILAPEGLKVGMKVMSGAAAEVRPGNCLPLSEIPVGTMVHNVELHAGKGGQLVSSALVEVRKADGSGTEVIRVDDATALQSYGRVQAIVALHEKAGIALCYEFHIVRSNKLFTQFGMKSFAEWVESVTGMASKTADIYARIGGAFVVSEEVDGKAHYTLSHGLNDYESFLTVGHLLELLKFVPEK